MLTRQSRFGLGLAALLGLGDLAILGALGGPAADRPPAWVIAVSVVLGVATLVLVPLVWRTQARPLALTLVVLRGISALGDLAGLGEDAAILVVSLVLLALSLLCLWLLRDLVRRPHSPHVADPVMQGGRAG